MCEHGDTIVLSLPGREQHGGVDIDRCLAPIVQALNAAGIYTLACCCGHGAAMGSIALRDGRELMIAPTWHAARRFERLQEDAPLIFASPFVDDKSIMEMVDNWLSKYDKSYAEFARHAHMSASTLTRLRQGKSCDFETLRRIDSALRTPPTPKGV